MKKLVRKDLKKRKNLLVVEKKKFVSKMLINNYNFNNKIKKNFHLNLHIKLNKNYVTQLNNRCIMTGRKKKLNKFFKFSRLVFLRLVRSGYIFGFRKSSW